MIVGYARTSTSDQTAGLAAQERDLRAAGAERVFTERSAASPSAPTWPSAWRSCAKATC